MKIKDLTDKECKILILNGYSLANIPTLFEVYRKSSSRGKVVKTPRGYRILKERKNK